MAIGVRLAAIALSKSGIRLCRRLKKAFLSLDLYVKEELRDQDELGLTSPFGELVGGIFQKYDGLIFVMAVGIVVRGIAPYLVSKDRDPAVVVLDDLGQHAIPLLSGHLGGANQLAQKVAQILNAEAVITTSTDLHHLPAFDLLAQEYNCKIERLESLKYISGAIVNGERVGLYSDQSLETDLGELVQVMGSVDNLVCLDRLAFRKICSNWKGLVLITHREVALYYADHLPVLLLRPQNLVVGLGFRKGKSRVELEKSLRNACKLAQVSLNSISKIVTIELKANESGLVELSRDLVIPIEIIALDQIKQVEDQFAVSQLVRQTIGVGGVAEPCAYLGASEGEWILRKQKFEGVTVAIRKVIKLERRKLLDWY